MYKGLFSLIEAYLNDDDKEFRVIALQIAAKLAKSGEKEIAREIRNLITNTQLNKKNKITKLNSTFNGLTIKETSVNKNNLVVSENIKFQINRIIEEYLNRSLLRKNGLLNRSKILMVGDPGTGKTMTASVISNELNIPLYVVQFDKLITRFMGETTVKLREIFNYIKEYPGVYLFDEFDAIGTDRNLDNDIGEMRRVLNSFLQFLEENQFNSIILTATNNPEILDPALYRRFDDVIEYTLPDLEQIQNLFRLMLDDKMIVSSLSQNVYKEALGMNHADIKSAISDTLKYSLLRNEKITESNLIQALQIRRSRYKYKGA